MCETKFDSHKNCSRPSACSNFCNSKINTAPHPSWQVIAAPKKKSATKYSAKSHHQFSQIHQNHIIKSRVYSDAQNGRKSNNNKLTDKYCEGNMKRNYIHKKN